MHYLFEGFFVLSQLKNIWCFFENRFASPKRVFHLICFEVLIVCFKEITEKFLVLLLCSRGDNHLNEFLEVLDGGSYSCDSFHFLLFRDYHLLTFFFLCKEVPGLLRERFRLKSIFYLYT